MIDFSRYRLCSTALETETAETAKSDYGKSYLQQATSNYCQLTKFKLILKI
jgi:hypothetical protein